MELALRARPVVRGSFAIFSAAWVNWVLCWIILPNAAFALMWAIGGPPRHPEIIATATIGLIVRKAPFWIKYAMFAFALGYSVLSFVSGLFNLSVGSLIASLQFLVELRPGASPEYIAVGVALAATLAVAWRWLRRPTDFEFPWEVLAAVGLTLSFASFDKWMSFGQRGSYKRLAPEGAPFASATGQTRFVEGANGRHMMIVMVESMGLPRDPALRTKLFARWHGGDIAARYAVTTGSTTYYGSTTSGEVRELCGRWGDYPELIEGRHDCLPAQLAARGYQTVAYHSFAGDFFNRHIWYPNIGFQRRRFRDELLAEGLNVCPGVFPGACDRDVPAIIGAQLKAAKSPQLAYWLTVNSHLPVPADQALGTQECARFDPDLAREHPMSCRMFRLWGDLNANLASLVTDPALPPTDILVVGDHGPPFFDREERGLYDPEHVPWILLRHRANVSTPVLAKAAALPGQG